MPRRAPARAAKRSTSGVIASRPKATGAATPAVPPPFDPRTGAWTPAPAATAPAAPTWTEVAPEERKRTTGAKVWDVILGLDLGLLGLFALISMVVGLAALFGSEAAQGTLDQGVEGDLAAALWAQAALGLIIMGLIPFLWGLGTRVQPWRGAVRYFRLDGRLLDPVWGLLWAVALVAAAAALVLTADFIGRQFGADLADNPQLAQLQESMTWPLVIALSLSAGIGEEILFRGFLQKKVGIWWQAVLFALVHAGYGTVMQIVAPFGIGLFFGYLVKRGTSLWVPITAHVLFDVLSLGALLIDPEVVPEGP